MSRNVALYLRVSTVRQAEKDLSIPDQRRQAEAYCKRHGWKIVREYVERGASATTDNRPEFQEMMADARQHAFDIVLVHSYSRFSRDSFDFQFYIRELQKRDIELVSITQETGKDEMGEMVRKIMSLFDEYQSKENGKHTLRAMKENARQGFWNGSPPPFGYEIVDAVLRGDKMKKHLAIRESEAKTVRKIFELYLNGRHGQPMGVKAIATHLNGSGLRFRNNGRFSTGLVYRMLTRETYAGRHHFNKTCIRTRKAKPPSEWIEFATPAIVSTAIFNRVQQRLNSRQPDKQNPRLVNSPVLLTGIAVCSKCGGRMMLRTGKSGRYRYYTCSGQATKGKEICTGQSIPLRTLDEIVIHTLGEIVFTPGRVKELIAELQTHESKRAKRAKASVAGLRKELNGVDKGIGNLYAAIEHGTVELDGQLKSRINELKMQKDNLIREIGRSSQAWGIPKKLVSNDNLETFCAGFKRQLTTKPLEFKKSYLQLFVSRVNVDVPNNEIVITGPKGAVLGALAADKADDLESVLTSVQGWRPHGDSNPGYRRERGISGTSRDDTKQSDRAEILHLLVYHVSHRPLVSIPVYAVRLPYVLKSREEARHAAHRKRCEPGHPQRPAAAHSAPRTLLADHP